MPELPEVAPGRLVPLLTRHLFQRVSRSSPLTPGPASYNELEHTLWMKAAGFTEVCRINLSGPSHLIVGLEKK
jgi:hypothetical protein